MFTVSFVIKLVVILWLFHDNQKFTNDVTREHEKQRDDFFFYFT